MPFLPFVLLLAWQALSRSASFALGWATSLYFGQVPGRQGRMLSVVSLIAAGWVILVIGFAIPIFGGAALEAAGVIEDNFDVEFIHYAGLVAGIVLVPPIIAAITVWGEFHEDRSIASWLRLVPMSYPSTAMLGASVLQMVAFTPVLVFRRWRQKRTYVQVSLVMREGTEDDALVEALLDALGSIDIDDVTVNEASGPKVWPMRTVGFAAEHLLGAVVRGDPMRLASDEIEIFAYATNISIQGPKEATYRVRAAILRKLGFHEAYLTWNDDAQKIEERLLTAHREADGDVEVLRQRLDEIQEEMDTASLNSEEWNVLYRRRLQVELAARASRDEREAAAPSA
ncbi:MAG TPA: hypothetical protein VF365_09480 [Candidatus Limnocylindria bacterium]